MEEKMDKEIVFIWFGDNEPSYAQWSIENFKTMNPSWNVKYIKYSTDQILNHHKDLGDIILEKTIKCFNIEVDKYHNVNDITTWKNKLTMTHIVEIYRHIYLSQNKTCHDLIVYLDIDCFPIAPLDDFFVLTPQNDEITSLNAKGPRNVGTWIYRCQSMSMKSTYTENKDGWILHSSNNCIGIKQILYQIVKFAQLDKPLGYSKDTWQFIFNVGDHDLIVRILLYRQRFLDKKLWLGECVCNPFFTPIEHMQISERYKPNTYIIRKKIK